MNIDTILNKKGQIVTVETLRPVKVKKGREPIQKHSIFQARLGIAYDNMKSVIQKRDDGILPEENQGLPWGKWKSFPYIIEHNGSEYVRFSKVNSSVPAKTVYTRNGKEIDFSEVSKDALSSETKSSELDVFNIFSDYIVNIKG